MPWGGSLIFDLNSNYNVANINRLLDNIKYLQDQLALNGYAVNLLLNEIFNPSCLSLSGTANYVSIPAGYSQTQYCFEFWLRRINAGINNPRIISPSNDHWVLWDIGHTKGIGFYNSTLVAPNPPPLNTWQHYAVNYNQGTGNGEIFVNGVSVVTGNAVRAAPTGAWIIGHSEIVAVTTDTLEGQIDDMRIWNVARTQAEVQANMNKRLVGNEPGLVGYWDFNEGAGTIAADKTVNGNHASLVSGAGWSTTIAPTQSYSFARNDFPKVSLINKIRTAINSIKSQYYSPPTAPPLVIDGNRKQKFDFNRANDLESNLQLLKDLMENMIANYKYCGTFYAGEDGLL